LAFLAEFFTRVVFVVSDFLCNLEEGWQFNSLCFLVCVQIKNTQFLTIDLLVNPHIISPNNINKWFKHTNRLS